ncbi:MAG: TIGR03619 family F420-dependent LLM class oxidoreductase [Actinomycetota bacterium]|nr:TIGR03619 family F420-dependent LLM class oxidoreductase [Actinomycetota bacterium]
MNFGVGVPNVADFADPVLLIDLAREAEAAGWDGFFVWDHLLYSLPRPGAVEPWSVIAAAATVTNHIRVGVLVTAVPRRRPALLAQQVATIDLLSGGRTVFGAGLGSMPEEYARFGEDSGDVARGRRLDEALSLLQALWSPGLVQHRGEFFTVDAVELLPKPAQRPHPPIWIAGRWPNKAPFRRAARFDGVMPTHASHPHGSYMSVGELSEVVEYVRSHRSHRAPFDVVMEGESSDPDQLDQLAAAYGDAGLTWWIEKLGWWRGEPDAALARVRTGPPRDRPERR